MCIEFLGGYDMTKNALTVVHHIGNGETVKLTHQQETMAHAIAQGKTYSQARLLAGIGRNYLVEVGYTPAQANQKNTKLATKYIKNNPDILIYANHLQQVSRKQLQLTTDTLLKQVACIVNFDPASLCDSSGQPHTNIHDVPEHARAAIKEFKCVEKATDDGVVRAVEYKFYSKLDAIALLTKLQELAGDKLKARVSGSTVKLQRSI